LTLSSSWLRHTPGFGAGTAVVEIGDARWAGSFRGKAQKLL
jgi:hypothetical protein